LYTVLHIVSYVLVFGMVLFVGSLFWFLSTKWCYYFQFEHSL
jgi:uncharacterized membrane protein YgdD (TMEM256/DUF423 family)